MATRNILFNRQLRDQNDGSNEGSGGDTGGNENRRQQSQENNTDSNLNSFDDLWSTNDTDENNGSGGGNNNGNANENSGGNANENFQKHMDSLDFLHDVNVSDVMQSLQNGDGEAFSKALQQIGANAYRNSLVDANKIAKQHVDRMADTVKTDVNNQQATSAVISEMNQALPFTKQAAYAPIAKLTLTQFLNKGMKREEAIKKTGEYFENLAGQIGGKQSDSSRRPGGGFNNVNSSNSSGNDSGEPDWIDMLGGPAN